MKALPLGLSHYKSTPDFTELTVPKGLLSQHRTKPDCWGKIVILEGLLLYRILEAQNEEIILTPLENGIVEPEVFHEVEVIGSVRFRVEFYK